MDELKQVVENNQEQLIASIQDLVKINSVEGEPMEGMPFGEGVDQALKFALELGEALGFKTVYQDGYYGYIEMGEGKELIGILGHLDVVPVEKPETWSFPPFEGQIYNNRIYGRGALDDKGPTLAALYAMKAVKESGIKLNKRVRLILGTNEETHWKGINKYLEKEEIPSIGFSPDSDFPMINAEKGLLQLRLYIDKGTHFQVTGGSALNSVPDSFHYKGEDIHKVATAAANLNYDYKIENNSITILGKAAHSAKGWEGINAIARGAIALTSENITSPILEFISKEVEEDVYCRNIFGNYYDDVSGKLTFNVAKIRIDDKKQEVFVDVRLPVTKQKQEVLDILTKGLSPYNISLEELDSLPALYVPEDHYLIKTLRKVYEETTGMNGAPIATGGATYARAIENCVAFGSLFPGEEKTAHKSNEYIAIDSLMKSTLIYANAIVHLVENREK
ncbi:MAG: dipeptidase PepV [Clostridiaceae bacterium]|nr:dipeptidase PepV [Clostridiaceae bacterium]